MRTDKKVGLMIIFLVVYVIGINLFASAISGGNIYRDVDSYYSNGENIKLGVSDYVEVRVLRERFYGFYENIGGREFLYLFWFIKVPFEVKGLHFIWIHLVFLASLAAFYFLYEDKPRDRTKEKTYFDYEPLV